MSIVPLEFTEEHEKLLYEAVYKGVWRNRDIADCLGMTEGGYRRLKDCNHEFEKPKLIADRVRIKELIEQIIKKAEVNRREKITQSAKDGLLELVSPTPVVDKVTEYERDTDKSSETYGKMIIVKTKETIKHARPNATSVIFELCNNDKENYQSINKTVVVDKDNQGIIASYFNSMNPDKGDK